MTEEVDRLTKLVDLSLLEAGQSTPEYTEVDLPATLRQVIQKSRPLVAEKNLALIFQFDESMPVMWVDIGMLQQMVMNAIRYTATGSITVTAGQNRVVESV